jgi:hypothetical protein
MKALHAPGCFIEPSSCRPCSPLSTDLINARGNAGYLVLIMCITDAHVHTVRFVAIAFVIDVNTGVFFLLTMSDAKLAVYADVSNMIKKAKTESKILEAKVMASKLTPPAQCQATELYIASQRLCRKRAQPFHLEQLFSNNQTRIPTNAVIEVVTTHKMGLNGENGLSTCSQNVVALPEPSVSGWKCWISRAFVNGVLAKREEVM